MFKTLISLLPFSCHVIICACGGYLLWRCVSDIFDNKDNIKVESEIPPVKEILPVKEMKTFQEMETIPEMQTIPEIEEIEEIEIIPEMQEIEEMETIKLNEEDNPKLIIDKESELPEKDGCDNAIITDYSNNVISFKEKKGKLFLYGTFQIKDDEKMHINWRQLYTKINIIKVIDVCSRGLYKKFLKYKEYDKVPYHHVKSFKNYFI